VAGKTDRHVVTHTIKPYTRLSLPRAQVFKVMGVFAATFLAAIALSVPFLREPPPGYKPPSQQYVNEQSVRGWMIRKFATKSKRTPEADKHYSFVGALRTQEFALLALMVSEGAGGTRRAGGPPARSRHQLLRDTSSVSQTELWT
jgi:hypothetical protein